MRFHGIQAQEPPRAPFLAQATVILCREWPCIVTKTVLRGLSTSLTVGDKNGENSTACDEMRSLAVTSVAFDKDES